MQTKIQGSNNTHEIKDKSDNLLSMEPWAAAKNFQLAWRCHQLLSGFLVKDHLSRVSCQSRRSLMIRVIMKYPGGCAQISWHMPNSRGKSQKTSARRQSDEGAVRPVIASNEVSRIAQHVRKRDGKKLRKGRVGIGLIRLRIGIIGEPF